MSCRRHKTSNETSFGAAARKTLFNDECKNVNDVAPSLREMNPISKLACDLQNDGSAYSNCGFFTTDI